jgi:hypothetical protein
MMDDTPWVQSEDGAVFTSIEGIGTAASWLPCVLQTQGEVLPGTCVDCVVHSRGAPPTA